MTTLRENFDLMEYSEEFIKRIIDYRMNILKNKELYEYYTYDEIAEMENCSREDVHNILSRTSIVWNHWYQDPGDMWSNSLSILDILLRIKNMGKFQGLGELFGQIIVYIYLWIAVVIIVLVV